MRPLVTPKEMADADAQTVSAGTPVETLMDRAGRAIATRAITMTGGRYGKRVAVVCGKGSNGGDGFAAAYHLAREGLGVRCLSLVDPTEVSGAAAHHLQRCRRAGVVVETFDEEQLRAADLVIDAVLGTGFKGPIRQEVRVVIDAINVCGTPVLAADIPSGVDGTTGGIEGLAVEADETLAIEIEKLGTAVFPGSGYAGHVTVASIGIAHPDVSAWAVEDVDLEVVPRRDRGSDKRTSGHIAIWAGSDEMAGAAILATLGGYAAGAGYVSLVTTSGAAPAVIQSVPEAVVAASPSSVLGPPSLEANRKLLDGIAAVAVGPGLGRGDDQAKLLEALIESVRCPLVIDADGLNVLAGRGEILKQRAAPTVLTPHEKELARLLGGSVDEISSDRPAAARMAARTFGAVILLKGPRTIVVAPEGRLAVVTAGGPELATAGTGDVLTGIVTALISRGLDPWTAAWCGAQMHSLAGEACLADGRSITARDIAAAVDPLLF